MEKQSSAVKGAMSLFNTTPFVKDSNQISPSKLSDRSKELLNEWFGKSTAINSNVRTFK
jgi:hypothetical protein